jgi:hypothetical protein
VARDPAMRAACASRKRVPGFLGGAERQTRADPQQGLNPQELARGKGGAPGNDRGGDLGQVIALDSFGDMLGKRKAFRLELQPAVEAYGCGLEPVGPHLRDQRDEVERVVQVEAAQFACGELERRRGCPA